MNKIVFSSLLIQEFFQRPKMIEKNAILILPVEFKSKEKTSLSIFEKKIQVKKITVAIFALTDFSNNR